MATKIPLRFGDDFGMTEGRTGIGEFKSDDVIADAYLPIGTSIQAHNQCLDRISAESDDVPFGVLIKESDERWTLSSNTNSEYYLRGDLQWARPGLFVTDDETISDNLYIGMSNHANNLLLWSDSYFASNTFYYTPVTGTLNTRRASMKELVVTENITANGVVTITGDLFVVGNTTTLSVQNVSIEDSFIEVRRGNNIPAIDTGIQFNLTTNGTGVVTNSKTLKWNNSLGRFQVNNDGNFVNVSVPTDKLSSFANTTSSELASVITDETGSGKLVFDTSATLTTPIINGSITTNNTSFDLVDSNAVIVNFAGSGTTVNIGAATGNTNIKNNLIVNGQITSIIANVTPFVVSSNVVVSNLNSDLLDGQHGSYYNSANNLTGTIPDSVLVNTISNAGTFGSSNTNQIIVVDSKGRITNIANVDITISSSQVSGLANSATIDTTNANNISSGIINNDLLSAIPNSKLQNSSITINGSVISLGGSATIASGSNISYANTTTAGIVQLYDGIDSSNTSLVATANAVKSVVTFASNANNITSGTLSANQLATSGVTSGTYGSASIVPVYTVDNKGRITSSANTTIAISSDQVSGLATSATTDTTNANNISSGTINTARLGSGIANGNTFLSGNNTWQSIQTNILINNDITGNNITYPLLATANSGYLSISKVSDSKLYYYPDTGTLTATNYRLLSDISLKTDIKPINDSINIINQLNPVEFTWKDSGKNSYGLIAQEIQKILPELVSDNNGIKSVDYLALIAILIDAIKELSKK